MEKVSIIVPVYNGEARLGRCVESILNQDYPELQLILVDDGSKDGSYRLMEDYARRDPRVTAIHKENGGPSSTRNRGLREAEGRYIQFVDVDDWLPLDATKLMVREMEESGAELVVGDFYRVVEDNVARKGSIEKGGLRSRQDYADEMLRSPADFYYGALWNKLYRRDLIERYEIRMDENIRYSEDMIFNLEYLLHVSSIAVLKAPVYYYQYTKGSLVDQSLNLSSTVKMKTAVIKYYDEFYKSTFDPRDYQERLPVIYSFLIAVGKDGVNLPFAPGTKKLGTEAGRPLYLSESLDGSPFAAARLRLGLLDRYLNTLAGQHGLDRTQALVLYATKDLDRPLDLAALEALTGLSRAALIPALAGLLAEGLLQRTPGEGGGYRFQAPALKPELDRMEEDYRALCAQGLTEEEAALYHSLEARVSANLRRRLQAEE